MQSILEDNNSLITKALDFFDLATGKSANTEKNKGDYMGGSISKYVKDLVMTFPTMFDTSLSPSTAGMISRANERNIVTMLELLFGSMQLSAPTGKEALAQIHKNLNGAYGLDDIMDLFEGTNIIERSDEQINIKGLRIPDYVREMTTWLKTNKKSYPVSSLRETSLNDYKVYKDYYGNDFVKEYKAPVMEAKGGELDPEGNKRPNALPGENPYIKGTADYYKYEEEQRQKARRGEEKYRSAKEELPRVMSDMDIKKANELTPTLMVVTFNRIGTDGKDNEKASFITGVKSRLIPVESSDIIERLAAKKNTALNFVNLIRATTGEISFVKDFLFAVNQSKILAKNSAKKGSVAKMWNVLDSRHIKNNRNALKKSGNDASAITTLVVNQETVNMLKKDYNYDVEDPKIARYIMTEYNLLGFIICDESVETAKILYHGNAGFELTPYTFLNRENDSAKAYKEVINLMNTQRR